MPQKKKRKSWNRYAVKRQSSYTDVRRQQHFPHKRTVLQNLMSWWPPSGRTATHAHTHTRVSLFLCAFMPLSSPRLVSQLCLSPFSPGSFIHVDENCSVDGERESNWPHNSFIKSSCMGVCLKHGIRSVFAWCYLKVAVKEGENSQEHLQNKPEGNDLLWSHPAKCVTRSPWQQTGKEV